MKFASNLVDNSYITTAIKCLARSCNIKKQIRTREELYQEMLKLHPQSSSVVSNYPSLPQSNVSVNVIHDSSNFIKVLESLDNGSSPGVSGWNGNYIRVLSQDIDCRKYLANFFTQAINNKLPPMVSELLLTSMLVGIDKPNGSIRPIAIGEVFVRGMAKYVLSLVNNDDLQSLLKPHQFGVGFSNGCETAVHTIQQCLSNPQTRYVGMCIDFKNAFNCVDRSEMIAELFKHKALQPLWSFCHWCYSSPTNLAVRNRDGTYNISKFLMSVCGCRQGGPESALLFAIALQPLLIDLSNQISIDYYSSIFR